MGYDANFYDTIRDGTQASAAVVVPLLLDLLELDKPRVVDVGAGEGWWAHRFAEYGCDVVGLDGAYVESSPLGDRFIVHDLTTPLPTDLHGKFDLVVCLEVAEHLPARRAISFVEDLCKLAPIVVFSAAIPGQGGTGHVNEAWPNYWTATFDALGFFVTGDIRYRIWDDEHIENWYRQNLIVAWDPTVVNPPLWPSPVLALVHPVLYEARRR